MRARPKPRSMRRRHRRGMSMLLVMIAVSVALILGMSFLHAQATATGMADNLVQRAEARALAESGLAIAINYIETNDGWRSSMINGTWVDDQAFGDGSFTILGEDGVDTDGDGTVDGDADLADDESDPVTLTAIGARGGVTHAVRAVITPIVPRIRLLLVVPDPALVSIDDQRRRTQFMIWGYEVSLIGENDSQAAFDAAIAEADVVYVSETVYSSNVNTKLRDAPVGVVCEESNLNDDFGLASVGGPTYTGSTDIDVTDATHFITSTLGTGLHSIVDSTTTPLRYHGGTLAPDLAVLATRAADGLPVLAVIEVGGTLEGSTETGAGRRVILPWGGDNLDWDRLEAPALTIAQRALEWASQPPLNGLIAHWSLNETAGTIAMDMLGGFDGTYTNGVVLGGERPFFAGTHVEFDGVDDYVEVPHDDAFKLDDGTVVFWFRTEDVAPEQGLISKDASGHGDGGHLSIHLHEQKVRVELFANNTGVNRLDTVPIAASVWHHVAFTFGSAGMKLYFNGVLVDSDPYAGGLGATSGGAGNSEPMAFGVYCKHSATGSMTGWEDPLLGAIDDVRLFDRALTPDEIAALQMTLTYSVRWDEQL